MKTSYSQMWKILRFFQLHAVYRMIKGSLPLAISNLIKKIVERNVHTPLVDVEELQPKYEMAWQQLQSLGGEVGDYLEFGVSRGTSMRCMHDVVAKLELNDVRLFGFDSFQGMPESAAKEDNGVWKPGDFASTFEETREFLDKGDIDWTRTHLIKGWFEQTLNTRAIENLEIRKASVIMIDCDIYSASKRALNFSLPLITDYTVVFFDDWCNDDSLGECKAYKEFLHENKRIQSKEIGSYLPAGRIFLLRNIGIAA